MLRAELIYCYLWFAMTPVILLIGRRFPIERRKWLSGVTAHLITSIFLSLAHPILHGLVIYYTGLIRLEKPPSETCQEIIVGYFYLNLLFYWATLGISYAVNYYRKLRDRELRALQLESQLAQAQLQNLKAQLHPHFLFNTLHAISVLMSKDVAAAKT